VDGFVFGEVDGVAFLGGAVFFVAGVERFAVAHSDGGDVVIEPFAHADHVFDARGMADFDLCFSASIRILQSKCPNTPYITYFKTKN
jgi:hypothetical protein